MTAVRACRGPFGFAIALGFAAARTGRVDAGLRAAVVVRDRDAVAGVPVTVRDLTAVRGRAGDLGFAAGRLLAAVLDVVPLARFAVVLAFAVVPALALPVPAAILGLAVARALAVVRAFAVVRGLAVLLAFAALLVLAVVRGLAALFGFATVRLRALAEADAGGAEIVMAAPVSALAADDMALVAVFIACMALDIVLLAVFIACMAVDMVFADEVALVAAAAIWVADEATFTAADDTVFAAAPVPLMLLAPVAAPRTGLAAVAFVLVLDFRLLAAFLAALLRIAPVRAVAADLRRTAVRAVVCTGIDLPP